jgi:hypothetical protein
VRTCLSMVLTQSLGTGSTEPTESPPDSSNTTPADKNTAASSCPVSYPTRRRCTDSRAKPTLPREADAAVGQVEEDTVILLLHAGNDVEHGVQALGGRGHRQAACCGSPRSPPPAASPADLHIPSNSSVTCICRRRTARHQQQQHHRVNPSRNRPCVHNAQVYGNGSSCSPKKACCVRTMGTIGSFFPMFISFS